MPNLRSDKGAAIAANARAAMTFVWREIERQIRVVGDVELVPDEQLQESALAYARQVASRSSSGLALMKRMTDVGLDMEMDDGLQFEVDLAIQGLRSVDADEGLGAFAERRQPEFSKRKP